MSLSSVIVFQIDVDGVALIQPNVTRQFPLALTAYRRLSRPTSA